ncbi:MAG TPA: MFS transporter [Actinomycetes bacterium]|nr:MFS transporter [Actinomycetes bacterium]
MAGRPRRLGRAAPAGSGSAGHGRADAAALRDWSLLLAGCGLLGAGNAAVMLARYAAADLSSRRGRGRSISMVVAAASVGAVAGPNLLGPAGTLARTMGLPEPTGLFILAVPAFLGAALVLLAFLRPDPLQVATATALATEQSAPAGGKGNLATLFGDRHIRLGLLVLATANLTMVGMMAVAPVHLHAHGVGLGMVGLLVSVHIAAMYLPSPVTGWLSDTLGAGVMAGVGMLLLLGAGVMAGVGMLLLLGAGVLAAVRSTGQVGTMGALLLLLLGVGWNAGLIGGSALLRDAPVEASLRTRAEGLGELGMGATAAVAGGGAGLLLATGGFALLGLVAAAPCLLVLAVVATVGRSRMGILGGIRWSGSAPTGMSPAFRQRGSR